MRINSFGLACQPLPEPLPQFYACSLVDEERAVLGSDGKTISKEIVKVSRRRLIPKDEFRNDGIDCDLFGVEVQTQAGVQLHDFSSHFYGVPLESRQELENIVNASLDNIEAGINSSDSSSINFN